MIVTPALQNLIREGKTPQMQSFMLSSAEQGSMTMDNCLIKMVAEGKITADTAVEAAVDQVYVRKRVLGA
jgi:twitching motility protein PilT